RAGRFSSSRRLPSRATRLAPSVIPAKACFATDSMGRCKPLGEMDMKSIVRAPLLAMFALVAWLHAPIVGAQSPAPLSTPNLELQNPGSVQASVALADGSVIVGGTFTSFDSALRPGLAKFKADGTLDPAWHPTIAGDDTLAVLAIAVDGSNG